MDTTLFFVEIYVNIAFKRLHFIYSMVYLGTIQIFYLEHVFNDGQRHVT
ncbi:Protein of unknown function [Pseudolactococcus piscium]|nr:Protein of unknown function [Lactococcus piscium]